MHIARFFDGYSYSGESSFTEEVWLKRKRPLIIDKEIDKTFYDQPAFIRYNVLKEKFEYFQGKGVPNMEGTFVEIEEKYIQDRAWEDYRSSMSIPKHMHAVSKAIAEKKTSSKPECKLILDSEHFLRYIKEKRETSEVRTCCKSKSNGLRV